MLEIFPELWHLVCKVVYSPSGAEPNHIPTFQWHVVIFGHESEKKTIINNIASKQDDKTDN